jgi:2-oxoglutarate dehydrogenase E2 component (dihydrolipoamide succinyltransferase)
MIMAVEMYVPAVGESIAEVIVGEWIKSSGDYVERDEVIGALESDKTTFDIVAESAGILEIKAEQGTTLKIGDLMCLIAASNGEATAPPAQESPSAPVSAQASGKLVEMQVPPVGESISEVILSQWNVAEGDFVELDQIIGVLDSDKSSFEIVAQTTGVIHLIAEEGATLAIGDLLCKIEETQAAPASKPAANQSQTPAAQTSQTPASATHASGHPSPAAAKILAEKGIEPQNINGTGVVGRITKQDAIAAQKTATPPQPKPSSSNPSSTQPTEERGTRREKMTTLRKTIAKRLVAAKNQTAMLTTFNEVDMSAVMELRKKYKDKFKDKHDINLGFMSFFTKAVTMALKEVPAINAQIDGEEMIFHDYMDVGIAVSSPRGLVVPVVRNAEKLSLAGIEKEIMNLAIKARDGKLTIEEMTGGTFTITNGGIFGSMLSTPILNAPQSAILGMHNIVERPVAINGQVVIRPIMYLALSYDHRIVDGKESVTFLYRIKELLEDPARLLLEV